MAVKGELSLPGDKSISHRSLMLATLGKKESISKSYVFGTIVVERFLDMFMLFLMILLALFIFPLNPDIDIYKYLLIVFIILCLFILLFKILKNIKIKLIQDLISNFPFFRICG